MAEGVAHAPFVNDSDGDADTTKTRAAQSAAR
jgi:hypothetical protein